MRSVYTISVILCLVLVACGEASPPPAATPLPPRLRDIQNRGQLIVGMAITRPFEYYDETGKLVGFDVDLMNLIARRLEVGIEWHETAFADLLPQLAAGAFDVVIAAMYIRPEREALVDMSAPYLQTGLVLVVAADNDTIHGFEDLAGRTLGVKEGATGEAYARRLVEEQGFAINLRVYTDTRDSLDDLNNGLLDAVFNDRLNTLAYMRDHPGLRIAGDVFDPAGLGIAVRSGDSDLLAFINSSLAALQAAGEIDRLFAKWIGPQTQP